MRRIHYLQDKTKGPFAESPYLLQRCLWSCCLKAHKDYKVIYTLYETTKQLNDSSKATVIWLEKGARHRQAVSRKSMWNTRPKLLVWLHLKVHWKIIRVNWTCISKWSLEQACWSLPKLLKGESYYIMSDSTCSRYYRWLHFWKSYLKMLLIKYNLDGWCWCVHWQSIAMPFIIRF